MFGLTFDKLIIIGVIAAVLLGPTRIPGYAAQLGKFVRNLRSMADGAKERMRDEMGEDFDDVDWKKLDPRQYDPRRIIREALLDDGDDDDDEDSFPKVVRASRDAIAESTTELRDYVNGEDDRPLTASEQIYAPAESLDSDRDPQPAGGRPPFDTEAT
jgi:Sec-independent protein translocase protein TatA